MSNLILVDQEEDASLNMCKICMKSQGKYTCPRCSVNYCSLGCYQSELHSECSEDFYRRCVLDEIKLKEGDLDAEEKMKEILLRLQHNQQSDVDYMEELDSDDECEPDLADRLSNINLDDPDSIWEKLTAAEKQEFEHLVNSGDVAELLPTWKPWWNYRKEKKMVVEVKCELAKSAELEDYIRNCPPVKDGVQPLSQITKSPPADVVKHNVMNVLAAYCYLARWFNGEHCSFMFEAAQALTTLSRNLSQGNNYESAEMAVEAVALEADSCGWLGGSPEAAMTMRLDLIRLLAGPEDSNPTFYLQAALSDMHSLLSASKKSQVQSSGTDSEFSRRFPDRLNDCASINLPRSKLKHCAKKIEYYLSWAQEHGTEICPMTQKCTSNEILTTDVSD